MKTNVQFQKLTDDTFSLYLSCKGLNVSSIELTTFVYPYDKAINADSFHVLPYEEYIHDIELGKRSTYERITPTFNKIFGISLGIIILLFFLIFNPADVFSVQSIISIFGAYTIGKELWNDLDSLLVNMTLNWRIKVVDIPYYFSKQSFGTIQKLWNKAREKRYGKSTLLADKLDLVNHSNSKTIKLLFKRKSVDKLEESTQRIIDVQFQESQKNFKGMIGIKLSLIKSFLWFEYHNEYFEGKDVGAESDKKVLHKKAIMIGRVKVYLSQRTLHTSLFS